MNNDKISRRARLIGVIYDLATKLYEENELAIYADKLKLIYSNKEFRHLYSDFLPIIVDIEDRKDEYSLEKLLENITLLSRYVEQNEEYYCIEKNILKIFDHVNLEIARFGTFNEPLNRMNDINAKVESISEQMGISIKALNKANRTAKGLQTQMITILGVFAAIIVSFFGGMSFISSAVTSVHSGTIFKSAVIVIIAGIVLVNMMFTLLYTIAKIIDKNIYAECKTECCTCGLEGNENKRCNPITRVAKRLPYIFYLNLFLLALLIIVSFLWHTNIDSTLLNKLIGR